MTDAWFQMTAEQKEAWIEDACERLIGLHLGYSRVRCEAMRDLALRSLSQESVATTGAECADCGFRYSEYKGHIIPCPLCAQESVRSEALTEEDIISLWQDHAVIDDVLSNVPSAVHGVHMKYRQFREAIRALQSPARVAEGEDVDSTELRK